MGGPLPGARHEKLGTYNLYVEENTEAVWPWTLSLLSPGQYQVIQNISTDKLISILVTIDIVNWYVKKWYHHSDWLAFGAGFFVSMPRGDLLWERYAWCPCRWGCLEPLQGDFLWRNVFFISRFGTSEWKFRKESEPTMHVEVPIQRYITFHLAQDQTCEIVMRYELWRSLWIPSSEKRFCCWLYHFFMCFPVFSGEMWWLSMFGTSCVARHSQSFWDSLGTKTWSRNLGCSRANVEVEDLNSATWFVANGRVVKDDIHDMKESYLQLAIKIYQGMCMWMLRPRKQGKIKASDTTWVVETLDASRTDRVIVKSWFLSLYGASSYHSFSLEDGFHDYVIRGDKADALHVFWESIA